MSNEWLTTGQLIDRLKVGEVAESFLEENKKWITRCESGLYWCNEKGRVVDTGEMLYMSSGPMKLKWRILPNYVSFEEAMKALKEGKKVKVLYDNGEHDYIFHYSSEIYFPETTWMDLLDGKWTIEDDTP